MREILLTALGLCAAAGCATTLPPRDGNCVAITGWGRHGAIYVANRAVSETTLSRVLRAEPASRSEAQRARRVAIASTVQAFGGVGLGVTAATGVLANPGKIGTDVIIGLVSSGVAAAIAAPFEADAGRNAEVRAAIAFNQTHRDPSSCEDALRDVDAH